MPLKAKSTWTDVPCYFCDKESYLSWLTFINTVNPLYNDAVCSKLSLTLK